MTTLPAEVREVAVRYRELAGPLVRDAWVIGSAALGDWWPGSSDIDLVAVIDSVEPDVADGPLRALHARVRAGARELPDLEVLYVRRGDLAGPPDRVGDRPHQRDGLLRREADMVTPVIWHSIAEHGVEIAAGVDGDRAGSPDVWLDDAALRDWCRANLVGYWRRWATRAANPATRAGLALLTDWALAWCVLGVLRLHHTVATGTITSKTGAGEWGLDAYARDDGERALIAAALAVRRGAQPVGGADADAAARREQVVAFLRRATAPVPG